MNIKHSYLYTFTDCSSKQLYFEYQVYYSIHVEPSPGKLPISIFFMFLEILQSEISQSWYVRK